MVRPSVRASTLVSDAVEPLLDDQPVAGLAEDAPDHDLIDGVERLPEVVADVDAFAGGQAVGLEDHAQRPSQHEVAGLGGRAEDAALAAFLDFDLNAGAEHLARVHDPVDGLQGLAGRPAVQRVADRRAPPRTHDQGDLAREDVMLGVGARAERPVIGRRNAGLPHQLLGEDLAPFQLGGLLARSENPQPFALKDVNDSLGQRLFGSDHRQADPLAPGELEQAPEIARLDRHVLHIERRPALPGAQKTAVTRGDCFSFQQRACSRPPLPITRTFNALPPSPSRSNRAHMDFVNCQPSCYTRSPRHVPRASSSEPLARVRLDFSRRSAPYRKIQCGLRVRSNRACERLLVSTRRWSR